MPEGRGFKAQPDKIKSFYIGSENSTGILCEDKEEFIEQIREEIRRAEEEGREHFDITIEQSE